MKKYALCTVGISLARFFINKLAATSRSPVPRCEWGPVMICTRVLCGSAYFLTALLVTLLVTVSNRLVTARNFEPSGGLLLTMAILMAQGHPLRQSKTEGLGTDAKRVLK